MHFASLETESTEPKLAIGRKLQLTMADLNCSCFINGYYFRDGLIAPAST